MSKLNKKQIDFIDNYLIRNKIKYWDVRIELLDHIICEVEQKIEQNFSFDDAMEQVHKNFGNKVLFYAWDKGENTSSKSIYSDNSGYKKLLIEKRKHITKKIGRTNVETSKEILRNYKIMIPFLLFSGLIFSFLDNIGLKAIVLGGILLMVIPCVFVWVDQYRKRKNKSLGLVVYATSVGLSIHFPNLASIVKQIDESILSTQIYLYLYTTFSILALFFTLINFIGYKKLEKEYNTQYKMLIE
ncbi:hypothetical protein [Aquimarina sp. 2201CG14-23]|uniref:hypothetical protein n=1 Tax=Aquimarina mycalae TaxID=3040073 RepID=UPI002477E71F|nr:hypothetical protein [Aquimarina sp. 2201CG14-23]MDH7446393.1 hypothetical protein [Aquimarina sp. 2201CG14-23]